MVGCVNPPGFEYTENWRKRRPLRPSTRMPTGGDASLTRLPLMVVRLLAPATPVTSGPARSQCHLSFSATPPWSVVLLAAVVEFMRT